MQYHKYSLTELENMIPFEREIYLGLLEQYIREENEKAESPPVTCVSDRQRVRHHEIVEKRTISVYDYSLQNLTFLHTFVKFRQNFIKI